MNDIAVLLPVFNDLSGLVQSLNALNEDADNYDVIVVDDGSDSEIELPEALIDRHRVKILRLEHNRGIEFALNTGLAYILERDYRYIARLDAGDLCVANRLQKQQKFLDEHEDCMLVGGYVRYLTRDGDRLFDFIPPTKHREILRAMHLNSAFCHPGVMLRKEAFSIAGMYPTNYPAAEDYALFFKIASLAPVANLDVFVLDKVDAANSISNRRRRRQLASRLAVQQRFFNQRELASYLGVLQTLVLFVVPGGILKRYKQLRMRLQRH